MCYREILREAINKSGKSLDLIAKECFVGGFNVTTSYLSKLQNGKKSPASDKVNNILAKVLNIDADKLLVAAYREKVPAAVLEKLAGAN